MRDNHHFIPDITILYCGGSLAPETFIPEGWMDLAECRARFVRIPCSSKIEPAYILKLFEAGADAVLLMACPTQDCQFLFGGSGSEQRVKYAQRLLDEVGLGKARLTLVCQSGLTEPNITLLAVRYGGEIAKLGLNPINSLATSR